MKETTKIVLDAMGGDNAPVEIIKGAIEAVNKREDIEIILTGKEDIINQELAGYTYNKAQVSVVHTSEVIETAEPPVMAIRKKKDSSIVVGLKMVKTSCLHSDYFVKLLLFYLINILVLPIFPKKHLNKYIKNKYLHYLFVFLF